MTRLAAALVFIAPLAQARECPAPPRSSGWQVDVDAKTGTVTRFSSYKKPER